MAKAKTLIRRKRSSTSTSKLRLRRGMRVSKHNPFKALLDEKLIAQAFWECLKNNDPEGAIEMVNAHLSALNKLQFAKKSQIPRSTIYHTMRSKNPTIKTMAKLIHSSIE